MLVPEDLGGERWAGARGGGAGGAGRVEVRLSGPELTAAAAREALLAAGGGGKGAGAGVSAAAAGSPPLRVLPGVVRALERVGWGRVCGVCPHLRGCRLRLRDRDGRAHVVAVEWGSLAPNGGLSLDCTFPEQIDDSQWRAPRGDTEGTWLADALEAAVAACDAALERFQEAWAVLEDMDAACVVVEPQRPTYATLHRRLLVAGQCALLVHLRPDPPVVPASLQFLGPPRTVDGLKKRWFERCGAWDHARPFLDNLEAATGLDLRATAASLPAAAAEEEDAFTCAICYAEELGPGGDKPCITCANSSCNHWFHRECLEEYLGDQAGAAGFLGGTCPYCSGVIEFE